MNLNDLMQAFAGEMESANDDLAQLLEGLLLLDEFDPALLDALDGYTGLVERLGSAAEMAGLSGLTQVCSWVVENALAAASNPVAEREAYRHFLSRWPQLVIFFLKNYTDPTTAGGLVDHLKSAPQSLDDEAAMKLMHKLGSTAATDLSAGMAARAERASPADIELSIPDDVDSSLLQGFVLEAPAQVAGLAQLARDLAHNQFELAAISEAKRLAHTLKGTAAIIGIRGIVVLSHHTEDILEYIEQHRDDAISPWMIGVLLNAAYCLEQMVGYLLEGDEAPSQALDVLQAVLDLANAIDRGESLHRGEIGLHTAALVQVEGNLPHSALPILHDEPAVAPQAIDDRAATANQSAIRVPLQTIEQLFRVSSEISLKMAAMESKLSVANQRSQELLQQNIRVNKRLMELETLVDIRSSRVVSAAQSSIHAGFDPLEMDQYNELHSTSHALQEESADARMLSNKLEDEISQLQSIQYQQHKLAAELQHLVILTRMTKVGVLASRLQRTVHATCQATGKLAELVIHGADILLDGDVLNGLAEPLLHLLRNAIDHGLEPPDHRQALGKNPHGTIVLTFERLGQQAVVRCQDDGYGLDLSAVRQRALQRGLIDEHDVLSDEQLARLILHAGFSTRDSVNEISGRGVGLNVVNEWALSLNGGVQIQTELDRGSCFTLRFQASLSTQHALVVALGKQLFALPSTSVVQAVSRGVGEFSKVAGQSLFSIGNKSYPLQFLAALAGLPQEEKPLTDYDIVIVKSDQQVLAVLVDQLLDARELLLKDAGPYARHICGVAGLSIRGDGAVVVMLDLSQLLQSTTRKVQQVSRATPVEVAKSGILIVDDSLAVRNSLAQLMNDAGFNVKTARDGLDAVETLRAFKPDLLLTDLEMPNMNGLELTFHVRNRQDLQGLPVIMITSRSQDKHRQQAALMGVDTYITKPYTDGELLVSVREAMRV